MKLRLSRTHVPLLATIVVFGVVYVAASIRYEGFFSYRVLLNLFRDNCFLGLAALGMSFVILSGGIDLSVGARIGFTSILLAKLIGSNALSPEAAIALAVLLGALSGACMGALIHFFQMPPFLVTLGGMFLFRGLGFVVSLETIIIQCPMYRWVDEFSFNFFPFTVIVLISALAYAMYLAHLTRFGRSVYAVGGNEESALLMGLSVGRTKVLVYTLSGAFASVGGVLYTFYTSSGNASAGTTLELDAIAAVVIGGTLLSGGIGSIFGTMAGVLILGVIQTILVFEGTFSSWWTKIFIGILLLLFILLQRMVQKQAAGKRYLTGLS